MSTWTQTLSSFEHGQISIRELNDAAHLLITSAIDGEEAIAAIRESCGVDLPPVPGSALEGAEGTAFWLSPRSWLLRIPGDGAVAVLQAVSAGFSDRRIHAVPYSDALQWFGLSGPGAQALLARGGYLSLSRVGFTIGQCKRTLIADIPLLIWRRGLEDWVVACERSRAEYYKRWMHRGMVISAREKKS